MRTSEDKLLEYSMPQQIMSSKLLSMLAIFLMTSIVVFPYNSASVTDDSLDDMNVGITTAEGLVFENYINISGKSSIPLSELVWSINDIIQHKSQISSTSNIFSSSTFTDVTVSENKYFWELSIPVNGLNCTCTFSIAAPNNPRIDEQSIVLFVGQSNHFPVITHKPNFQNFDSLNSKFLHFEVVKAEDSEINSMLNELIFMADICQYSGNSCVSETSRIVLNNSLEDSGFYVVELSQDFLNLADGNWYFEIFVMDSFLRLSNADEMVLTFDITPPKVEILGAVEALEMESELFAANVDDGYDSSLVALTWTITEPNGEVRGLVGEEYVSDSSVRVEFNQSGTWKITVLAIDSAGHYTREYHEIIIENIAPEISLQPSIKQTTDSLIIISKSSQQWYVDASMSYDTTNDIDSLVFNWIVNEEVVHDGKNLTSSILTKAGNYEVTLVVTDNDGLSTKSSFNIVVESEDHSNSDGYSIILVLVCLLLLSLTVILLIRMTKGEKTFNVPKWGK